MKKYPADYLIYEGPAYTVEWYYTEEGELPAYEYFRGMDRTTRDRFFHIVKYLADASHGEILPKIILNIEDKKEKIYALKPGKERFFIFMFSGRKVIVTNAYRKHSQQMMKKDKTILTIAIGYKHEYTRRVKEGTYYG